MPTPVAGKDGRLRIDGVNVPITKWSAELTAPKVNDTNSESNGWQELLDGGGIRSVKGSFTARFDAASSNYTDPPHVTEGQLVTLELIISNTNGRKLSGTAYVESVKVDIETEGTESTVYEASFESSGAWTRA